MIQFHWRVIQTEQGTKMKHEKTFEAISKLKDVEIELHRLKNALEMTNRALETKDEPVGWIDSKGYMICVKTDESCRPLYTTPQRTWVGLTEDEIHECFEECCNLKVVDPKGGVRGSVNIFDVGMAIEAKLKEKNT